MTTQGMIKTEKERDMPKFSSTLVVNSLFWFTSLGPNEQGVTQRIQEDLRPYLDQEGLQCKIFEPRTAKELLAALGTLAEEAKKGLRPIIHFDMHGNLTCGISLTASGEFVPWSQLVAHLRAINVATDNNLLVVSGACFSMEAARRHITLSEACPFFILIAPVREVSSGFLEDNTVPFYRCLIEGGEVVAAHEQRLSEKIELHHSERFLAFLIANYIRDYCIGKGGRKRREQLLTKATGAGLVRNRYDLRKVRKAVKAFTRPDQGMANRFTKFASTFLIGKAPGFDIDDVMKLVKLNGGSGARELRGQNFGTAT